MKKPYIANYGRSISDTDRKVITGPLKNEGIICLLFRARKSVQLNNCIEDDTRNTFTVEPGDPDDFLCVEGTGFTHAVEPSDPDDFSSAQIVSQEIPKGMVPIGTGSPKDLLLNSDTYLTKAVEPSDPDDFNVLNKIARDETGITENIEPSDPDDFLSCIGVIQAKNAVKIEHHNQLSDVEPD